ncbi:MAG: hypothetical protein K9J06_12070, partial [Flavobacteriales bacterium]|nr:hypothetical protein [Flavobacteriales bacterium]
GYAIGVRDYKDDRDSWDKWDGSSIGPEKGLLRLTGDEGRGTGGMGGFLLIVGERLAINDVRFSRWDRRGG